MLLHLIVVLALAVAALYGFIGLYVVPKLARLADRTNGLIRAAQYGAAAFFVGCAMTHIALAEHMLSVPELVEGHEWVHLLPHLFQVVGGTTFALIAWLALDVRLRTKEEALLEAEGARLREQLERSQRLNGLGQLAGGVAHDFNNLLAVIGGYGRLLDRRLGDRPELRADAREIVTAAERGAELTRQMLVFSRGSEREVEAGDINRAIERQRDAAPTGGGGAGRPAGHARLRPASGGARARADRADPAQSHAQRARRHAGRRHPDDRHGARRRRGAVHDRRYRRGDGARGRGARVRPVLPTKPEGEGTGLGLSVVYGIVERAGGRIELESTLGAGTRFTLALPATRATVTDEPPAREGDAGSLRGVTVLVVDDQESVRTLVTRILEDRDARVIGVPDGRAALDAMAVHEDAVDVVLTDIVMPGMSGTELARRLRSERPALPLIYFSGYVGDAPPPEDGRLIRKPFTPAEIVTAVADAVPTRLLAGR